MFRANSMTAICKPKQIPKKGASMRLGSYSAIIKDGSVISQLYDSTSVSERHRHRYEVNPEYHDRLMQGGLFISGTSEDGRLAEFIEIPTHKYFGWLIQHVENLVRQVPRQ